MTNHTVSEPAPTAVAQDHTVWRVLKALAKASLGLLNPKIWLLSFLPLLIAGVFWGAIAFFSWDFLNDTLRATIQGINMPLWLPDWIPGRTLWIPLIILLLAIPAVLITTLALVGLLGTGLVARRVGVQYGMVPQASTALAQGANLLASIWHSVWVLTALLVVWSLALLLYPVFGVGVLVQFVALAWANTKLFSRDVLAEFADSRERVALLKAHKGALFALGLIASVPAAIPSLLWLGAGVATLALPIVALFAVWLYVMIFLATSLLFSHYLLPALKTAREHAAINSAKVSQRTVNQAAESLTIDTTVLELPEPQAKPTPALQAPL